MQEELQETRIEEFTGSTPPAPPNWLRLAYAFEYLVALPIALLMWTQVDGQGHMDLLPWYVKLFCAAVAAWCAVRLTAALVEQPTVWNRRSRVWLAGLLIMAGIMASITFYYHMHEIPDEPDTDETTKTSVSNYPSDSAIPIHLSNVA